MPSSYLKYVLVLAQEQFETLVLPAMDVVFPRQDLHVFAGPFEYLPLGQVIHSDEVVFTYIPA
jgi:hypothetical protein